MDIQNSLASWIKAVADSWLADEDKRQREDAGDIPPEVQRNIDDAELAHELADFVRGLSDSNPLSARLLEQVAALEEDGWATDGPPAERLRNQMSVLRRQLNTVEAKHQAVETVVRTLYAQKEG